MPDIRDARGFIPTRTLGGGPNFHILDYRVSGNNHSVIMRGDLVHVSAGEPQKVRSLTTALSPAPLGVVAYCLGDDRRPLTFNQPTRGPYIQVSSLGWVGVYVDPSMTYNVQCDATAVDTDIGRYIGVTAGIGNTAAGYSNAQVRATDIATTAAGHFLQIIGISPDDFTGSNQGFGGGAAGIRNLEVRISRHLFNSERAPDQTAQ